MAPQAIPDHSSLQSNSFQSAFTNRINSQATKQSNDISNTQTDIQSTSHPWDDQPELMNLSTTPKMSPVKIDPSVRSVRPMPSDHVIVTALAKLAQAHAEYRSFYRQGDYRYRSVLDQPVFNEDGSINVVAVSNLHKGKVPQSTRVEHVVGSAASDNLKFELWARMMSHKGH